MKEELINKNLFQKKPGNALITKLLRKINFRFKRTKNLLLNRNTVSTI